MQGKNQIASNKGEFFAGVIAGWRMSKHDLALRALIVEIDFWNLHNLYGYVELVTDDGRNQTITYMDFPLMSVTWKDWPGKAGAAVAMENNWLAEWEGSEGQDDVVITSLGRTLKKVPTAEQAFNLITHASPLQDPDTEELSPLLKYFQNWNNAGFETFLEIREGDKSAMIHLLRRVDESYVQIEIDMDVLGYIGNDDE